MKEEAFMNYGKRKASKKQKRITSKKNMHKKKLGVRLFKGFLLCIFVCCILAAIGGGFIIKHVIDNAPEITADSIKPQGYTSTALADDGTPNSPVQVPTVYIRRLIRSRRICSMHSSQSKTPVFTSITVLISKVLSVLLLLVSLMVATSLKEPVPLPSS